MPFPPLPEDWEATRAVLHAHTAIAGVVARAHIPPHPNWWHIGLTVTPAGLTTDPIPLPGDGGALTVVVDPGTGTLRIERDAHVTARFDLATPPSEVVAHVFDHLTTLGLPDVYDRARLHDDPAGPFSQADASAFWASLTAVAEALDERRATRPGEPGPVQLWPHGFDIAFEWFGSRMVQGESGEAAPAQLNLGWYPGGEAYFYSNPWPFDEALLSHDLPRPARWHTEGWQGTMLPYADVAGDPDGSIRFAEYADAVFAVTRQTLDA